MEVVEAALAAAGVGPLSQLQDVIDWPAPAQAVVEAAFRREPGGHGAHHPYMLGMRSRRCCRALTTRMPNGIVPQKRVMIRCCYTMRLPGPPRHRRRIPLLLSLARYPRQVTRRLYGLAPSHKLATTKRPARPQQMS